jgi:hypothetical protein
MASSLAIFALSRGLQAGQGLGEAYKQQVFAKLQSQAVENQMIEIDKRARTEIGQIYSKADRVVAEQQAAFIKGGVKLEGSAMDVISDTMADAAEAAYVRRREADYELEGLSMQKGSLDFKASDQNLFFNQVSSLMSAGAGFATDYFSWNRGALRDRGTQPYSVPKDIGSGSKVTYNYSSNNAMGLA